MAALRVHGRLLPLLLSLLQLSRVSATCYWPNHTIHADETYQTCGNGISSDSFSMCCAIQGRSSTGHDTCNKNGLCSNQGNIGNSSFWRESCTDMTWQSESCLKLCITGLGESSCSLVSVRGRKLTADGDYRSIWRADECK